MNSSPSGRIGGGGVVTVTVAFCAFLLKSNFASGYCLIRVSPVTAAMVHRKTCMPGARWTLCTIVDRHGKGWCLKG